MKLDQTLLCSRSPGFFHGHTSESSQSTHNQLLGPLVGCDNSTRIHRNDIVSNSAGMWFQGDIRRSIPGRFLAVDILLKLGQNKMQMAGEGCVFEGRQPTWTSKGRDANHQAPKSRFVQRILWIIRMRWTRRKSKATQPGRKTTSVVRRVHALIVDVQATASISENGE